MAKNFGKITSTSASINECKTCPANYTLYEIDNIKTCLKYGKRGELSSAVSTCAKDGAQPPLPKNAKENADLLTFFNSNRARTQNIFALDLNDVKTEGSFVNSMGEKVNFTNWHGAEPDNKNGTQNFVVMWNDGTWNDYEGNLSTAVIICQIDCLVGKLSLSFLIRYFLLMLSNFSTSDIENDI